MDATLVRCTFVAHPQRDQQWDRVFWKECWFEGVFHKVGLGPYRAGEGDVERCDFRDAKLHEFELRNCDPLTSQFAPWPTFVLLYPHRHKEAIRARKWPGWMTVVMAGIASSAQEWSTAIVMNGRLLVKELAKNGTKLSLKELRAVLARLGPAVILDGGPAVRGGRRAASLN